MDLNNQVVVVTGGASGIGRALCEKFAAAGARVAVADLNLQPATQVAEQINGIAVAANVGLEEDIQALVRETEERLGPIDIFVSNAGVAFGDGPGWMAASGSNDNWMTSWNVNVMAHVFAARALVPDMIKRGGGYLVNVASGAGLLCQLGDAAYSTTKHAAVGFAESLAITHGDDGIKVSCLCPQAVSTRMIGGIEDGGTAGVDGIITPEQVAATVVQGLAEEKFLLLPHPEVEQYRERKTADYDRWLGGMRKLRRSFDNPIL